MSQEQPEGQDGAELKAAHEEESPQEQLSKRQESGLFDGVRYNVGKLYQWAVENFPVEEVPLDQFRDVFAEDNQPWIGAEGEWIGPHEIVKDWEAAQKNPSWAGHIASMARVDMEKPILVSRTGHVIDGLHRLARAFVENRPKIKVIRLHNDLPKEASMGKSEDPQPDSQ
jgi:hypothetical protein